MASERIIKVISNPTKDTAESTILAWIDTKDVRPPDSYTYAILNDSDHNISSGVTDAMKNWEIFPILWSKKESAREKLAA